MLLQLTTKCHGNCKHCFVDATPEGRHMNWPTLNSVISFIKHLPPASMELLSSVPTSMRPVNLVVSGGEFTEHPEFAEMITHIANELPDMNIILESNGSWLGDPIKEKGLRSILGLDMVRLLLVTTHHKYYPDYNKTMLNKEAYLEFGEMVAAELIDVPEGSEDKITAIPVESKLRFDPDWQDNIEIVRLGRGENLPPVREKDKRPAVPNCMQMIMISHEQDSLAAVMVSMEHRGLYTSPIFGVDGKIHNGVSQLCTAVGHVHDQDYEGIYDLIKDTLNPCGLCNLNERIPEAINIKLKQSRRFKLV